ncbi:hypothetical protein BDW62DRAFT_190546 [Aspergillus aurantiobrunneus]
MKLLAVSALLATASAVQFQAYTEPNWQGSVQTLTTQGFYYLAPAANSYSFDSEGGRFAFVARSSNGQTDQSCGNKDNLETVAPMTSVEIVEVAQADFC